MPNGKAKMIERLCEGFKPAMLLSDNGNLKNKNQFKSDIEKYTKYNKQMLNDIPEGLYFDLFCSFCDPDMKMKLSNIKGHREDEAREDLGAGGADVPYSDGDQDGQGGERL